MDEVTGAITLLQKLDREMTDLVELEISVKDNGIPSLNDSASVKLFIADSNDNSPVIHPNAVEIEISEVWTVYSISLQWV